MLQARRYAPFLALAAAQLLIVVVAPSRPGTGATAALGGTYSPGDPLAAPGAPLVPGAPAPGGPAGVPQGAAGGPAAPPGGGGVPAGPGIGAGAGGSGPGPGAAAPGDGAAPAGGAAPTAPTAPGGYTGLGPPTRAAAGSKGAVCLKGLIEHAPCVTRWTGADNGGATSAGVTKDRITVVMYRSAPNAAVDGILRSTGTYFSPQGEQDMLTVAGDWINKHAQLYGRTIDWKYVVGSCDPAPPQDACFRADADAIVAKYKPFALFWDNNTNEPAFFDELSRKGVVNWGGWHFADGFNQSLRPYHYDVFTGGDQQADLIGEYYCSRLANRKARFAGADLRGTTRKVAVIYADTPVTTPSAKRLEATLRRCDRNGVVDAPYSSDTTTASSQATTNAAKYKAAGVTTNIWFSDVIAPAFGTKAMASQNWFPEQVLAGSGLLDYDALAQTYDSSEWAHAFGPSDLAKSVPVSQVDAGRIWTMQGRSGSPDANSNLMTAYLLSLTGGLTAAGPRLTPLSYEYGVLSTPAYDSWEEWKDPTLAYVSFGKGDYTALSDIREVYWDPTRTSPINGRAGAYVPLNGGRRYKPGSIPTGEPALPAGV